MPIKKTKAIKTKNQSFSNKIDATVVASNIEDILVNFIPAYEENLLSTEKTLKKITSILKADIDENDVVANTKLEAEKKDKQDEQKSFLNILGNKLTSSLKIFKDFSMKALSKAWNIATTFISEQYKNLKMFVEQGFKTLIGTLDQGLKTAQETLPLLLSFIPFGSIIGKIVGGILFGIPRILLKVIPVIISGLFNIGGIIGRALFIDLPKKLGGIIKDSLTTTSGLLMWGLIFGFIFRKHLMQLFKTYIKPLWDTYVQPYVDKVWGKITSWFGNEKNIKWLRSFFPKQVLDVVDGIVDWWKNPNTKEWIDAIKKFALHPIDTFNAWWSGENGAEKTIFGKIREVLTDWWKDPQTQKWWNTISDTIFNKMLKPLSEFIELAIVMTIGRMLPINTNTKQYTKKIEEIKKLKTTGNVDEANKLLLETRLELSKNKNINIELSKYFNSALNKLNTTGNMGISPEISILTKERNRLSDIITNDKKETKEKFSTWNMGNTKKLIDNIQNNESILSNIDKRLKELGEEQKKVNIKLDKITEYNKTYPSVFNTVVAQPPQSQQQITGMPSLDFGIGGFNRSFAGDY